MDRLHIFRPGCFVAMAGQRVCLTAPDLAASAGAYDPSTHQAPLVLGHPDDRAPALGWVIQLEANDGGLYADVELSDELRELVQAGRFKKLSASFWPPSHPENPTPGIWSLRHVGFLGAAVPAVLGLKPLALAGCACGTHDIETDPIEAAARMMAGLEPASQSRRASEDAAIEAIARQMAGLQ